jgi:hypothetical protein
LKPNNNKTSKPNANEPNQLQSNQLRKLPPLPPPTSKPSAKLPPARNLYNQKSEDNDFELDEYFNNPQQAKQQQTPAQQPAQKKMLPVINQQSQVAGRIKPAIPTLQQQQQQHQQQQQTKPINTVVSLKQNEQVRISKQYASIGEDDSDENENWF